MINKIIFKIKSLFGVAKVAGIDYTSLDIYSDKVFMAIYNRCSQYTMTSIERMYSLYKSVIYVIENDIPGDFVECGVYQGGSSRMIAETLCLLNSTERKIYLYDTYEGMPQAGVQDFDISGTQASAIQSNISNVSNSSNWCFASLDFVQDVMCKSGYPINNLIFIKGIIEETLPDKIPTFIALLRLDTDWYSSTLHELNYLYPILSKNGILIIDDYGHWDGARKAVDEYLNSLKFKPILNRVDYTCRLIVKI